MSPQETNRFFAACARSADYAATAKNSVSQRSVKTGHSYKAQRERHAQGSSRGKATLKLAGLTAALPIMCSSKKDSESIVHYAIMIRPKEAASPIVQTSKINIGYRSITPEVGGFSSQERGLVWTRTKKFLSGDLEAQIETFVDHYNHQSYHGNLTT